MKNLFITTTLHRYLRSKNAFTIVDHIIELQKNPQAFNEDFQVWKITKIDETTFSLELKAGNLNVILAHYFQSASILIFELTVWLENSTLYFLSEH
ncbi:DUF6876 family protein [Chryseobacterium sp.]|uniref:DUF6876 family protein n=1 Tax=Chryseobacterium sp. TaxID=1871047 RepID=UPI00289B3DCF|nr:DUF6876 family protein [Chryseobacterium sp.]